MKQSENVIVYDTDEFELVPFQEGMNAVTSITFELLQRDENIELNKHRSGKVDEMKRYINYFKGGFSLFLHRKEYKYIVCWQQFYALTFAFFCNIFHVKKRCKVIACNYTYKEKKRIAKKIYFLFMRKCLSGNVIDYIHIPSNLYADRICKCFNYDKRKIIVTPFGILDENEKFSQLSPPQGYTRDGYFLSIGRSNRDYDFLMDAWKTIDFPLVIISDKYTKKSNNQYITIRNDIGASEQYNWINNCKGIIICLKDENIASGDTVLLTSMSLERIAVVSSPSTLAEMYIDNGENGILVTKDLAIFRKTILEVLKGKYDYIGKLARESYLNRFSRKSMGEEIGKYVINAEEI